MGSSTRVPHVRPVSGHFVTSTGCSGGADSHPERGGLDGFSPMLDEGRRMGFFVRDGDSGARLAVGGPTGMAGRREVQGWATVGDGSVPSPQSEDKAAADDRLVAQ